MKGLRERFAGLDVHAENIVVCVLSGNGDNELTTEIETFPTFTKDLFRLLKWMEEKKLHICDGKYRCLLEPSV